MHDPYGMIAPLYILVAVLCVLVMWTLDRLRDLEGRERRRELERRRSEAEAQQDAEAEETLTEPCDLCPDPRFQTDCVFCGSRPGRIGRVLR